MFRLRFSPQFARQQQAFLAVDHTPPLDLKGPIEDALKELEQASESLSKKAATPRELWRACLVSGKPLLFKATLASCAASFFATGSALIAMKLLDTTSGFSVLIWYALGYFACNTFSQLSNFATNRMRSQLGIASETTLVALISRKLLHLSVGSSMKQSSGNLKVLITSDVKNVSEFLNNLIRNLIPSAVSILIMAPFLVHFAGKAGWIGLLALAMILPVSLILNKISIRLQDAAQTRTDELATLTGEWVKNIRLVRFLSWDESFESRLKERLKRLMNLSLFQHLMMCIVFGLSTTWWMITGASVLLFAKLFHYPLQVSGYFGSLWLLTFIGGYFTHLPNTIRLLGVAIPSMNRIAKLLGEPEQKDAFEKSVHPFPIGAKPVKAIFENVCFSYSEVKDTFQIQNLNVEIRLNQQTAILGEVGSGKTTFLKLLCGEYPPTSGTIWIQLSDGSKRSLWEAEMHAAFRNELALVPQIPYVASDLLSVNIALTEDHIDADILNSIQRAEMLEDLGQFADGTQQMIGESGVNLSGGQRQRLNLARAFHSKRSFLVLDDTLSAVDARTETALMEKICETGNGALLVTHRLSEINRMAYVLVFQEGKLIEEGKPEILSETPNSAFTKALEAYDHE
jgi:ABC-type multidrug transport system fused ATPase/permease subunit